jgi:hypothetical protein
MIRTWTPMTEPYLATLNPEQRRAVEYSGDQTLLIIAGAGADPNPREQFCGSRTSKNRHYRRTVEANLALITFGMIE